MQIKIEDFEKCLECWKTLYRLDDGIYKIILEEFQNSYLTPTKTYAYIIRFLEIWGVRIAVNISEDELCSKINELKQQLEQLNLEPKQLEQFKVNLDDLGQWIRKAFDQICSVRYVGPTSASKILHLLLPGLFVMWDKYIAEEFRVEMNSQGYLEFLRKSQDTLRSLMNDYRNRGLENPEYELYRKYGKPLTKLLDEYNWLTITRKNRLNRC
jgi:hypothetical protein